MCHACSSVQFHSSVLVPQKTTSQQQLQSLDPVHEVQNRGRKNLSTHFLCYINTQMCEANEIYKIKHLDEGTS